MPRSTPSWTASWKAGTRPGVQRPVANNNSDGAQTKPKHAQQAQRSSKEPKQVQTSPNKHQRAKTSTNEHTRAHASTHVSTHQRNVYEPKQSKIHNTLKLHRARGVVVSHPLRMRKALGSSPSVSMFFGNACSRSEEFGRLYVMIEERLEEHTEVS